MSTSNEQVNELEDLENPETVSEGLVEEEEKPSDPVDTDEDIEQATAQGWVPKEQYKGNPDNWKSAKEFNKAGESINAILKERLNKVIEDNKFIKEELRRKNDAVERVLSHAEEQKKKAIEKAIKEYKAQRKDAITQGDVELVDAIDAEIETLNKEVNETKPEVPEVPKETPPEFIEWAKNNQWYKENEEMAIEAEVIAEELAATGKYKDIRKLLNAVTRRVKTLFPEAFTKPSPSVEGAGRRGTSPAGKGVTKYSYKDLPPEAKKACDEFVADGIMTKEQYVASYEFD